MTMIGINEPIRECKIILTELFVADGLRPRKYDGKIEFLTVAHLGAYLSGRWSVAKSLGYNVKKTCGKQDSPRIGRLAIEYSDNYSWAQFEFDNIYELVDFLEENPRFAEILGYKSKRS